MASTPTWRAELQRLRDLGVAPLPPTGGCRVLTCMARQLSGLHATRWGEAIALAYPIDPATAGGTDAVRVWVGPRG